MILQNYKPFKVVQKAKVSSGSNGFLTIINSKKNGRRVEFRREVAEKLNIEDSIAVVYDEDSVAFFRPSEGTDSSLRVKKSGERRVVYSGGLVSALTDFFGLKFDSNVSYTFTEGRYEIIYEINTMALIISKKKMANEEQEVVTDVQE